MNILRRSLRAHTPVQFLPLTPALLIFNTNNPMLRLYQAVLDCAWYNCLQALSVKSSAFLRQISVLKNPMKGGESSLAASRTIHEPTANPAVWPIIQLLFGP